MTRTCQVRAEDGAERTCAEDRELELASRGISVWRLPVPDIPAYQAITDVVLPLRSSRAHPICP
jgi:hypothetical protein